MASMKFVDDTDQVSWDGPGTGITVNFADQRLEMETISRGQVVVLVDYTKGDENYLEVLVELSPDVDFPITNPATGADYYGFSSIAGSGAVTLFPYQFTATGDYRVPTPVVHQERIMRLSVRRNGGTDAGAGAINIRVIDDSHYVTSALAGREPA